MGEKNKITHIFGNTWQLKLRRRLEDKNILALIVVHFERALTRNRRVVDKLQGLVKVVDVALPQFDEDVQELVEDVVPGEVRDEDVGGLRGRFVVAEAEPELGVGAGQDEGVRLHGLGAGKMERLLFKAFVLFILKRRE